MQDIYKTFADFILGDLCTRVRTRSRMAGRHKVYAGNFSCRTSDLKFKWRGTDFPMRVALAMGAHIQAGEQQLNAAFLIYERLRQTEQATLKQALKDGRFKPLKFPLGRTHRGYRANHPPRNAGESKSLKDAETIRVTALRYKANHPNFNREFQGWFAAYCMDYARTPEWLASQELPYRERLDAAEKALRANLGREPEPPDYDVWTISLTGSLAELLHELEKFEEALPFYELAITRLLAAAVPMLPGYREDTLDQLAREMTDCLEKRPLKQGLGQVQGIVAPHLLQPGR